MSDATPARQSARISSLDGLRGVAALVVLFHHSLLLVPALALPYYTDSQVSTTWSWDWWLVYSPLHLVWEGTSAVIIFFVLSGIVLTLPVKNSVRFSWTSYYPQRLVRLYVPVWAAVALGVLTFVLFPRTANPDSEWLLAHPRTLTMRSIGKALTLVTGHGQVATPLWSLRWEIVFSLLLPFYVVAAAKLGRKSWLLALATLPLVIYGQTADNRYLLYLPVFMVGVVLAVNFDQVKRAAEVIDQRYSRLWWLILVVGLLACMGRWFAISAGVSGTFLDSFKGLELIGAAIVIFVAIGWAKAREVLDWRAVQWLGRMSFSLYLIHEPIVVGFGYTLGPHSTLAAILASIAIALAVTPVFYFVIEKPSHRLAKAVGRGALRIANAWPRERESSRN